MEKEFSRLQSREKRTSNNLQAQHKLNLQLTKEKEELGSKLAAAEESLKDKDSQLLAQTLRVSELEEAKRELEAELERLKVERAEETKAWADEKQGLEADYEELGLAMFEYGKHVIAKCREVAPEIPLTLLNEVRVPGIEEEEEEEPVDQEGGGNGKTAAEEATPEEGGGNGESAAEEATPEGDPQGTSREGPGADQPREENEGEGA